MGTRGRVMVTPSTPGAASHSFICAKARQSTRPKHSRLLTCAGSLVQIREGHIEGLLVPQCGLYGLSGLGAGGVVWVGADAGEEPVQVLDLVLVEVREQLTLDLADVPVHLAQGLSARCGNRDDMPQPVVPSPPPCGETA